MRRRGATTASTKKKSKNNIKNMYYWHREEEGLLHQKMRSNSNARRGGAAAASMKKKKKKPETKLTYWVCSDVNCAVSELRLFCMEPRPTLTSFQHNRKHNRVVCVCVCVCVFFSKLECMIPTSSIKPDPQPKKETLLYPTHSTHPGEPDPRSLTAG